MRPAGLVLVLLISLHSASFAQVLSSVGPPVGEETYFSLHGGSKYIIVNLFGENLDIDTATVQEDVWNVGGVYTGFPSGDAETVDVFSSSANDTADGTGARTVKISGLNANWDIAEETITLQGTTLSTSVKLWRRVNQLEVLTAGSGGGNAGQLNVRHTTTTANVFIGAPATYNHSRVLAYTIPRGYTGYLRHFSAQVVTHPAGNVADFHLIHRRQNGVFVFRDHFSVDGAPLNDYILGGIRLEEKTDFVVRVSAVSANNTAVVANADILLVKN